MKIKLEMAGFIAGLTIFCATAPSTALACQEMPGDLHLISVDGSKKGEEFALEHDLIQANRIRLNEQAIIVCSEGEFCVENASIKTTFFFHPWTRVGHGSMTAVVNCLK